MSKLHQMQMSYNSEEDRLLLKASTEDQSEYRIWFTRAYTLLLWEKLHECLNFDPEISALETEEEKTAVLEYKKKQALKKLDFTSTYSSSEVSTFPLGADGVLAFSLSFSALPNGAKLEIKPKDGQGLTFSMDRALNNAFCKMLYDAVNKAEWDLGFEYENVDLENDIAIEEVEEIEAPMSERMKLN